jgi:microcystin degradation protein MlrC
MPGRNCRQAGQAAVAARPLNVTVTGRTDFPSETKTWSVWGEVIPGALDPLAREIETALPATLVTSAPLLDAAKNVPVPPATITPAVSVQVAISAVFGDTTSCGTTSIVPTRFDTVTDAVAPLASMMPMEALSAQPPFEVTLKRPPLVVTTTGLTKATLPGCVIW